MPFNLFHGALSDDDSYESPVSQPTYDDASGAACADHQEHQVVSQQIDGVIGCEPTEKPTYAIDTRPTKKQKLGPVVDGVKKAPKRRKKKTRNM